MAKTILVVDDNVINRKMLAAGLEGDYDIIEAADGGEAVDVIRRRYKQLSAVLLDIQMPVMDGYEVLRQLRRDPLLAQLPVIVVTGSDDEGARLRALECGANDFIQKPYNPDIIKHCLKNNITMRETASMVNAIQNDKLTGIYNREYFFEKAEELLQSGGPGDYVLACIDIDNFKLINDRYGAAEGDRILRHIGAEMRKTFDKAHGVCGRISGDNFAVLFPNRPETVEYVAQCRETSFIPPEAPAGLRFSVGRYVVTDMSLPVSALYDRAYIAKQSVKGRYDSHTAYFDESMLQALVMEQEIIGEMDRALKRREFEAWLQPQYNHATGALIGAEALARWRHPSKGLIPPGDFIPVFEENGFIYELDKYIWEEACRYLRRWLDEGMSPLPVSVNISRYDVFKSDLTAVMSGLLEKYRLPAELLRLEITESAFSKASEQIIATVRSLIELGFTVEIDDFGSGYSSLNTLKDVPAQVLKLDMRFLESGGSMQRSGSILESITRMARWIGMAVIAEGVETIEQADFLKSIGCSYVQGYLYARPVPAEEYETLARKAEKEERLISFESVVTFDSDVFWDPASQDTLIFNSFVGGACIFELCGEKFELLRVNDNYIRELGIKRGPGAPLEELDPYRYLGGGDRQTVRDCAERAAATGEEQTCELVLSDDGTYFEQPQYIRCSFRVIARAGDRLLFYCVISSLTDQRLAEQSRLSATKQLRAIMANIDGGVAATINRGGTVEFLFANDKYYELLGCTRGEYHSRFKGTLDTVHPDDRERVTAQAAMASRERASSFSVEYRIVRGGGEVRWLRSNVTLMDFPDITEPVQLAVLMDITEQAEANEQLHFLNDMAHELLAQPDVEEGLRSTLHKLREYFGGARAYIFEFDLKKQTASNTYEACADGVSCEKGNLQSVPLGVMDFWLDTFKRQNYLAIESVDSLGEARAEEREILRAQGISSIFAAPLYRDGKLIGMIGIDDPQKKSAQMSRLAALGDYIAVMLTRRDLNSQIVGEDRELLLNLRKPHAGLRETVENEHRARRRLSPRVFLLVALALCAALACCLIFMSQGRPGSHMDSFSESVVTLSDGWTLTDSAGVRREARFPLTVSFGADGLYTLSGTLPEGESLISSPALCIYSNYVDISVELDGETLLTYPGRDGVSDNATGNTYQLIRLPSGYEGKSVVISLRCQLGDDITYLIKAPTLGSKATMLRVAVMESLPSIMLAGCMLILAIVLAALYLFLRKTLELNSATAYTALFAIIFACYVFCETYFAQLLSVNPYALFSATLMLLALLPFPLAGLFSEEVSFKLKTVPLWLMALCAANFAAQLILNYTGVMSFRVMLPATHAVIIISITGMALCLLLSDRDEKPAARKRLLSALPMLAGGVADIVLLMLNRPSFYNSLWFTLGVTAFIIMQFCGFVRSFFTMYRISLEASVLRDMAYRDALTNIGNRNAYERKLKELTENRLSESLCCIVIDINDLKQINDRYGHAVGDAAIVETSRVLGELTPSGAFCYRAGGDEFIVLLEEFDEYRAEGLSERLAQEAERRGKRCGIPLSLAIGCGCYEPDDGSILDFIRRVDARMYGEKRIYKESPSYPFKRA